MILTQPPLAPGKPGAQPARLKHVIELDGLRGIAAIMVFLHHVCYTTIEPPGWNRAVLAIRSFAIPGNAGVDLFFVLSGFLITSLLLGARGLPGYYRDFYWKRALRILPLYLICLAVVWLAIPGSTGYVVLSALFISNFALFFHVASAGPFWTLAIEEQFYVLWPTLVHRRSIAGLRRWALGIALGSVALRLAAAAIGHHTYYYTFFHCDGLAGGAYLAFWFFERKQSGSRAGVETRAPLWMLGVGLVLCSLRLTSFSGARAVSFVEALYQTGVTLVCIFLITLAVTQSGHPGLAILRSRVLRFFGLISYAFYMIHLYVLDLYDHVRGSLLPGDTVGYAVRLVSVFGVTVALCLLSRYAIELPAASLRKYVLAPKPNAVQEA